VPALPRSETRETDRVVVFSAPLLVETGMHTAFDVLVVVSATTATQVERLMRGRGMSEAAILARIDAQAPLEDKAEVADFLVDNEGTLDELEQQIDRLWSDLSARVVA
jgi:dephospho-CoA kinase